MTAELSAYIITFHLSLRAQIVNSLIIIAVMVDRVYFPIPIGSYTMEKRKKPREVWEEENYRVRSAGFSKVGKRNTFMKFII